MTLALEGATLSQTASASVHTWIGRTRVVRDLTVQAGHFNWTHTSNLV
jgi:hypothetical protein